MLKRDRNHEVRTFQRPLLAMLAAVAIATCFTSLGRAQSNSGAPPAPVNAKMLQNVGTRADTLPGTWLNYGGTQSETRYSPLAQIDVSNVSRLGLAWTQPLGSGGANQEATPLVWNHTIYTITSWSVVTANDAYTGEQLWRWDPEVNQTVMRPRWCCMVNRGLAIYRNIIIAPTLDGRLFGLDAMTGRPIWEERVGYAQDNILVTMAPRMAGDKVIIGASGGDRSARGYFDAYDAVTGRRAWRFYTVPGDPSKPFENEAMRAAAKTWGGEFWKNGGGGSVWDGMAYDPEANLVYVGTGNAQPWTQKFRGAQNLDNLYTCSIVAVDLTTGLMKWYFQIVPNDNWDFDSAQQLMLLELKINGRLRKVIVQASKGGFFYVLDRITGEFISAAPYVRLNWALGIDKNGRPQTNPQAYYDKEPVKVYPSSTGGHNWAPMSFNPATGLVYIPLSYTSSNLEAADEYTPRTHGTIPATTTPKEIGPFIGPESPAGVRGGIEAWDPVNQKLIWRADGGGGVGGGTLSIAGNLVFHVTDDGRLRAFSPDKGQKLFEIETGRAGTGPPITYELNGKQYIAFVGGTGLVSRSTAVPTNEKIPNPPLLFVFTLDGHAELPKPAAP